MSILIFALIVIIIAALLIYAVDVVGILGRPSQLIKLLILVIAALAILQRAGLI
jgi:hypothetical protein